MIKYSRKNSKLNLNRNYKCFQALEMHSYGELGQDLHVSDFIKTLDKQNLLKIKLKKRKSLFI